MEKLFNTLNIKQKILYFSSFEKNIVSVLFTKESKDFFLEKYKKEYDIFYNNQNNNPFCVDGWIENINKQNNTISLSLGWGANTEKFFNEDYPNGLVIEVPIVFVGYLN